MFVDTTITTDIMTGFDGETNEEFKVCLDFIKEIGFEKVHTFPYSERKGTAASKHGDSVPKEVKEKRASTVIEEAQKIRNNYMNSLVGKTVNVLFENTAGKNIYQGYTKNYIPVRMHSDTDIIGKEIDVTIKDVDLSSDCCLA